MQKTGLYILFAGLMAGLTGCLYFLCLVSHIPFIVCAALVIGSGIFLFKWFSKLQALPFEKVSSLHTLILITGCISLIYNASIISLKHGAWDAWGIWNLHTRYLANPALWQNMFGNTENAHSDYPLALPSVLAFFYRTGANELIVNYAFHFLIAAFIPILIYIQTYKRGLLIPAIVFFSFMTGEYYIQLCVQQLADTLLAFFLLCAFIAMEHINEDKRMATVCGALLGCMMWTKNEGILLGLLFIVFYHKPLLQHYRHTLTGISLPLISLLVFKIAYAPQNDIIESQKINKLSLLLNTERHKTIYGEWIRNIKEHYYFPACGIALSILISAVRGKMPNKNILFILSCCAGYCIVYLLTPKDLYWHLNTSLNRLIHQLLPLTAYVLVQYYTNTSTLRFRAAFAQNQ